MKSDRTSASVVEFCSKAPHCACYRPSDALGGPTVVKYLCFLLIPPWGDNLVGSMASGGLSPSSFIWGLSCYKILLQILPMWISVLLTNCTLSFYLINERKWQTQGDWDSLKPWTSITLQAPLDWLLPSCKNSHIQERDALQTDCFLLLKPHHYPEVKQQ